MSRLPSWRDSFPAIPPHRSVADKLLKSANAATLNLLRYMPDDDGECRLSIGYELHGQIDGDDAKALLATLIREFNSPSGESEARHA